MTLIRYLAALCFVVAVVSADGMFSYYVETLLRAIESQDTEHIASYYVEDAKLNVNGREYSGRDAIEQYYLDLFKVMAHHRFSISSPVQETGSTTHHFQQMFAQGEVGCLAVVHSMEEINFNDQGHVVSQVSLWDELESTFRSDVTCRHGDPNANAPRETEDAVSRKSMLMDVVFRFHHAVESGEVGKVMNFFTEGVSVVVNGGENEYHGDRDVEEFLELILGSTRSIIFAPVGTVLARDEYSTHQSTLFFVSKTGCSGAYDTTLYSHHNEEGKISSIQLSLAGHSLAELLQDLTTDCGLGEGYEHLLHDDL